MPQQMRKLRPRPEGFSLVEVLVGVFLVAVAVVGMIQLFMMSTLNNARANEIGNAVFLAQQQIDYLRALTLTELESFPDPSRKVTETQTESGDEQLDVNVDGTPDFRRITVIANLAPVFNIKVLVFPPSQLKTDRDELIANPDRYRVRARVETVITR